MAHKKAGGSSRNGRDSDGRRLGVKRFGGERVGRLVFYDRGGHVKACKIYREIAREQKLETVAIVGAMTFGDGEPEQPWQAVPRHEASRTRSASGLTCAPSASAHRGIVSGPSPARRSCR